VPGALEMHGSWRCVRGFGTSAVSGTCSMRWCGRWECEATEHGTGEMMVVQTRQGSIRQKHTSLRYARSCAVCTGVYSRCREGQMSQCRRGCAHEEREVPDEGRCTSKWTLSRRTQRARARITRGDTTGGEDSVGVLTVRGSLGKQVWSQKRPSCKVGFGGGFRRRYCGGEDMVAGVVVEAWAEGKEEMKKGGANCTHVPSSIAESDAAVMPGGRYSSFPTPKFPEIVLRKLR
jgi:hypothetical protein